MVNKIYIDSSILDSMPSLVKGELPHMSAEKQQMFVEEYNRKKKSVGLAYFFLIICLGMPYGYLGKWGMQLVYWFTGCGLGIWFLILLFMLPGMVKNYNMDVAVNVMRDIKLLS